jgi:ribonucleotide reductase beta subunit family protein with ferritin-like domain
MSVCMYVHLNKFWIPESIHMKLDMHIYQGTWANLKGVIHKTLLSLLPILQPPKFLRQNLNNT